MEDYRYKLFSNGQFIGKFTKPQWRELKPEDIFNSYVYLIQSKVWYYSAWGSLVPLNESDIPNEIKALLLLTPIETL